MAGADADLSLARFWTRPSNQDILNIRFNLRLQKVQVGMEKIQFAFQFPPGYIDLNRIVQETDPMARLEYEEGRFVDLETRLQTYRRLACDGDYFSYLKMQKVHVGDRVVVVPPVSSFGNLKAYKEMSIVERSCLHQSLMVEGTPKAVETLFGVKIYPYGRGQFCIHDANLKIPQELAQYVHQVIIPGARMSSGTW